MLSLVDIEAHDRLVDATTEIRGRNRLQCVAREGTGDWLRAFSSKALGLHLRTEFILAGMHVFIIKGECLAPRHHRECIARHNHVGQVLYDTAHQANLAPVQEMFWLLPNSEDRPASVFLSAWSNSSGTRVTSPAQTPSRMPPWPGAQRKGRTPWSKAEGLAFQPLGMDTFGSWHLEVLVIMTKLGRQLAKNVERETWEQVRHLRQRLGVTLVHNNIGGVYGGAGLDELVPPYALRARVSLKI